MNIFDTNRIEFYRLLGVQHFMLYDNESEDAPREFLQPYIDAGIVEMVSWPPKDISSVAAPSALASEAKTKAQNKFLNKALKACWAQEWQTHKQGPCQFAASVDMLRRAEGNFDWLGFLDIVSSGIFRCFQQWPMILTYLSQPGRVCVPCQTCRCFFSACTFRHCRALRKCRLHWHLWQQLRNERTCQIPKIPSWR